MSGYDWAMSYCFQKCIMHEKCATMAIRFKHIKPFFSKSYDLKKTFRCGDPTKCGEKMCHASFVGLLGEFDIG